MFSNKTVFPFCHHKTLKLWKSFTDLCVLWCAAAKHEGQEFHFGAAHCNWSKSKTSTVTDGMVFVWAEI